jgi:hypothetical protein
MPLSVYTKSLAAASANNISLSQSPGAGAIILNGSTVAGGVATIDTASSTNSAIGRRVLLTSGGDDSGITFTVTGTNANKQTISDTFAGGAIGTAQSNLDFVTVTGVTHTGSVAGTLTIGTSGVGSSPWQTWNFLGYPPMNLGVAVEIVSGAVNYTIQYTYDDPNSLSTGVSFPLPFSQAALTAQSTTLDGTILTPIVATRVLINSGTGVIRVRVLQAGIG